jgi:hypothetical protein
VAGVRGAGVEAGTPVASVDGGTVGTSDVGWKVVLTSPSVEAPAVASVVVVEVLGWSVGVSEVVEAAAVDGIAVIVVVALEAVAIGERVVVVDIGTVVRARVVVVVG